jgi:hypothetical protein
MPSAVNDCPDCGKPGRWGFDDDWVHEDPQDALVCPREGYYPGDDDDA